ncbi:hypothetical protein BE08_44750 [Sorangium cellulosum]|uniref:Protein kinase domain-containing protein n=1 Tax=Sorangium cellulosum TaxID=56 RepID=A0A150PPB7_SORCE|nr:hypothetical protein BE08_44750 [Sorangium cellulosum]
MGEVVEAEHRALRKRVVVKLVRRAFARDPRFADRLRVEAQALAAVSSPHVVEVLDLGRTPAGRPYFVMERLEGTTLAEELARRGALPVAEAIDVVRQVLAGLSAAHRVGLVHRDVKLDNVFLCAPGSAPGGGRVAKLLDFGVTKVLDGGVAAGAPGASAPLALAGPEYPRRLRWPGRNIRPRPDCSSGPLGRPRRSRRGASRSTRGRMCMPWGC